MELKRNSTLFALIQKLAGCWRGGLTPRKRRAAQGPTLQGFSYRLLGLAALVWLVLLAIGPIEPVPSPVVAASLFPQQEQTTLANLPLPAQFSISEAIGRDQSSYHLTSTPLGFRAVFPDQTLIVDFSPSGLDIHAGNNTSASHNRFGPVGDDHWTMNLIAYGYSASAKRPGGDGDHLTPVEPAYPQVRDNRLEYHRGPLTEWYRHGPLGLQQGFTLAERPAVSEAAHSPLTLVLRLSNGPGVGPFSQGIKTPFQQRQTASVAEDGRSLKMGNLSYNGLLAYDAAGSELPAWLELHDDRLLLRVDDQNAVYPVFIDPWLQQTKLAASDGAANDRFGIAVAVSGDTVVVGSYGNNAGSAYVFVRPGGDWGTLTTLTETAKLTASDGAADDHFGRAVDISGDTIVVGASWDDDDGLDSGSAYVFVRPAGGWVDTNHFAVKLTASDGATGDGFGSTVAISGDTIVVGAPWNNDDGLASGSAYVFVKPRSSGGWVTASPLNETVKLLASNGDVEDRFGHTLAISDDTIVVGAPWSNGGYTGSAYVFVKPLGSGGWATTTPLNEIAILTASDGVGDDYFGRDVAISGDAIVVSANGDDDHGPDSGSAYVFVRPGGGWVTTNIFAAKLTASDGAASDNFGLDVAINGGVVVVGARYDDNQGHSNAGSAYIFVKPDNGWNAAHILTETTKLTASDGAADDGFGQAVAVSGNTVVVSAWEDDDHGLASGSAYIFTQPSIYLPLIIR